MRTGSKRTAVAARLYVTASGEIGYMKILKQDSDVLKGSISMYPYKTIRLCYQPDDEKKERVWS